MAECHTTVKDIGLHLLGGDLGYLSGKRDHFSNPFFANRDMERWESLVQNINEASQAPLHRMQGLVKPSDQPSEGEQGKERD